MNTRWRLWLLHLLTLCFFISAFEVNTQKIVNTWGDYCEAYLPVKYVANSVQSITVAPVRSTRQISQAKSLSSRVIVQIPLVYKASNQSIFSRFSRIYLRCCQWLN